MSKKQFTIQYLHELAAAHNGKCLSEVYHTLTDKYLWECNEGHIFEKTASHIKRGQWCPTCAGNEKGTIELMQELAAKNNGKCLSTNYVNDKTKLLWECQQSHIFEATPNKVKQGRWCPECAHQNRDIHDIQKIAQKKGGKLLSNKYVNRKEPLEWVCDKGHPFQKPLGYVLDGSWCPECSAKKRTVRKRWSIDSVKEKTKELGGECLSDIYVNNKTKMKFRCEHGHEWESRWDHINNGKWCPVCAGNIKKTIEEMRELAKHFSGECLSNTYAGASDKLLWKCEEGHIFEKSYRDIIDTNSWCSVCSRNEPRTIEEMRQLAEEKNGRCLSETYISNKEPLLWECESGHQWYAPPSRIYLQNSWCHECRKLGIESMREIATKRKGKCLSDEYINVHAHLQWECEKGHTWWAIPSNIKRGTWCPECSRTNTM